MSSFAPPPHTRRKTSSDERNVDFDLELLDALCAGYLGGHLEFAPGEIGTMAVAGAEMAVENGLRFLTDHIAGDRYFAVDRRGQNLDRCRTQLRLTELILDAQSEVDACFSRAARHSPACWPDYPETGGGLGVTLALPEVGPEAIDAIAELCARSMVKPPSASELQRALFAPDQPAVVRMASGVAVVATVGDGADGFIRLLLLDPEHRGRGWATNCSGPPRPTSPAFR